MKNLVVLEDNSWEFPRELSPVVNLSHEAYIISNAVNVINGEVILLTNTGVLISQSITSDVDAQLCHEPWDLNSVTGDLNDNTWFSVKIVSETGAIACLSHSGHIVSIESNRLTDEWADQPEAEGCVEAGIVAASWNPDESMLVIITGNDSLLCMSCSFEPLNELPMVPRSPECPCLLSWRGDGMQFCLYSVDSADSVARIRVFDKDLDMLFEGHNVGDGAQSVVKNLLPAMAYATNGSLIAVAQQRTPKKQQIVFLERSGLRHGEFDLQDPKPPKCSEGCYDVIRLEWNLESTLLAVLLEFKRSSADEDDIAVYPWRVLQIYHRNNYYWYLKQQWSGNGLGCLGFDVEVPDRLYLSENMPLHISDDRSGVCLRTINMVWDTCVSPTSDCTCAVVDGQRLKMTPLGKAVIPPPMCKYELNLPTACQAVSFGSVAGGRGWILGALCDNYFIRLCYNDENLSHSNDKELASSLPCIEDIDLRALGGETMETFKISGIQSVVYECDGLSFLVVVCVAISVHQAMSVNGGGQNILVLWKPQLQGEIVEWALDSYPIHDDGRVQRLIPWANDSDSIGVGILMPGVVSTFDITKMVFIHNKQQNRIDVNFLSEFAFSENCSRQLAVIKLNNLLSSADDVVQEKEVRGGTAEDSDRYIFVGISSAPHTSRLYVNDNLLSSSHVTSFAANPSLGILMFVTSSAKPLLQFTSIENLYRIVNGAIETNLLLYENNVNEAPTNYNATTSFAKKGNVEQDVNAPQNSSTSAITLALPRPVERGARLVGSPDGSALVVLQLPRGNLEGCEPRPLVLMKSRLFLAQCKYFDCLLLLRRQRVDMNLLVDHDPFKFIDNISQFVSSVIHQNPEYLSLLISALEVDNVCMEKYPIDYLYVHQVSSVIKEGENGAPKAFPWNDKVNVICQELRSALFSLVNALDNANDKHDMSEILLPILCTYAKQQPPLLADALYLTKRCALGLSVGASLSVEDLRKTDRLTETEVCKALSSPKSQKCIKYIAFLSDYNDLFRAALAECDFDMARTIAKQSGNMDPKEYLPLLNTLNSYNISPEIAGNHCSNFEKSGISCEKALSASYCLMRFNVFVHLELHSEAVMWALQVVRVIVVPISGSTNADNKLSVDVENEFIKKFLSIVTAHNLHTTCISSLREIRADVLSATSSKPNVSSGTRRPVMSLNEITARKTNKDKGMKIINSLLSKVMFSYGERCHSQGHYDEAIAAFLCSSEPSASRCAVHAAIVNGNWQEAIAIGGRYYVEGDDEEDDEFDPFSSNKVTSLHPKSIAQSIIEDYKSMLEQGLGGIESKEYISIFCLNTRKTQAANVSGMDLPEETSESQAVGIATLCLEYFNDIEGAISILILAKAWKAAVNMAYRHRRADLVMEDVGGALRFEAKAMMRLLLERTERHTELVTKLNELWTNPAARLEAVSTVDSALVAALRGEDEVVEETRSEFGGGMSVYSNMSLASNLSNLSSTSNTSNTLSMLSDSLMSQSSLPSQSAGYFSKKKPSNSSFSVVGLEHDLLSKGHGTPSSVGDNEEVEFRRHETNKQKRLRRKKENRGKNQMRERDVFGLKQESAMCKELYDLGDISSVATSVNVVCGVLVLIGGTENQLLACQLQASMDAYTEAISTQTTPLAPLYPLEWLRRREMEEVRWFQASTENANPLLTHVAEGVWWRKAVRGLSLWKNLRKNTLISSNLKK